MPVETIPATFSSKVEMERLASVIGITLRGDDDLDGVIDADVVEDAIIEATDCVWSMIADWYDPIIAADNLWVRRRATWIACYLFSQRRGNPAQWEGRYQQIMEDLENVLSGKIRIPRLPWRADLRPSMSNYRVDDRYTIRKLRVEQTISTGGTYTGMDPDTIYHYEPVII